jgi:hypothetical protein
LGVDDQLRMFELAAQAGNVAIALLDLPRRRIWPRPAPLRG